LSYIATSDPRIPAKLSRWIAATMICEKVNISGARAMAIPKTVGTPMRSAKHGHSMYVSVALSETPPTAIAPHKESEQEKEKRFTRKKLALRGMCCQRITAAQAVERAKGLKTKWQAKVEDMQDDICDLEESLRKKRKQLNRAEWYVNQKDTLIAVAEKERTDIESKLALLWKQFGDMHNLGDDDIVDIVVSNGAAASHAR